VQVCSVFVKCRIMDEVTKTKDEKEGWDLIINDLKKKELIPIKILSFLIFASKQIFDKIDFYF